MDAGGGRYGGVAGFGVGLWGGIGGGVVGEFDDSYLFFWGGEVGVGVRWNGADLVGGSDV